MGRMNIDKKTTNGLVYTWIIIILADYMFYMHTSLSSRLYGIMVICSFIYILIKNNYTLKITKYILFVYFLEGIVVLFTFVNNRVTYSYLCALIAELLLTMYIVENLRNNRIYIIDIFSKAFLIMFIADIISVIFCLISKKYDNASFGLVGHKNYHSFLFLLTLMFNSISLELKHDNPVNFKIIVISIISIITEVIVDSASGIVAIFLYMLLLVLMQLKKIKFINLYTILIGLLIVNYIIVIAMSKNSVFSFIFSMLGRDAGLSGRSTMWNLALELIKKNFFWGYGFAKEISYYNSGTTQWVMNHCHNFFLNLQLTGGIIYFVIYLLFLFKIAGKLKHNKSRVSYIITYGIGCYLLLGISEIIVNVNSMLIPLLTFGYFVDYLTEEQGGVVS